jgi:hypothetical protein
LTYAKALKILRDHHADDVLDRWPIGAGDLFGIVAVCWPLRRGTVQMFSDMATGFDFF